MLASTVLALAGLIELSQGQAFLQAISTYPELSRFSNLLSTNPAAAQGLLSFSSANPGTILVPNNNAFLSYQAQTGQEINAAPPDFLLPFFSYHILNGSYGAQSFTAQQGVTLPTLLTGQVYNNRSAGAALSSQGATSGKKDGQVVYVSPQPSGPTYVQSGLAARVNLSAVDGTWDGGKFHIIDGVLTLPQVCTKTITNRGLSSLSASLNRTGLASVLDTLANVTCLGPTDEAFRAAGNPDAKLNVSDLTNALLFHTIPQPLYSNFLQSGQTFKTANNETVRVTLQSGDIYFNDAKVLQKNVLTNNGLIHVLDRIMSPLTSDMPTSTSSAGGSPTPSVTTSSNASATKSNFVQVPTSGSNSASQTPLSYLMLFSLASLVLVSLAA